MKWSTVFSSLAVLFSVVSLDRTASAQEPETVYVVESPAYPSQRHPAERRGRFRFGIDAGGGFMTADSSIGDVRGPAINVGLRLGWQFNDHWALYYQGNLPIGIAAGRTTDDSRLAGVGVSFTNAVMGELTLAHLVHFGLGPSLDTVFGGICTDVESSNSTCIGAGSAGIGADARVALTFGYKNARRRGGFSLGLDLHPTFVPGNSTFFFATANLGFELY